MSFNGIHQALQERLASVLGSYALKPVGDVTPAGATDPFIRGAFVPIATGVEGQHIGTTSPIREEGTFQIGIFHPVADGPAAMRAKADEITAHFRRGVSITAYSNGVSFQVRVVAVSRGPELEGDGILSVAVNVGWQSWRPADT